MFLALNTAKIQLKFEMPKKNAKIISSSTLKESLNTQAKAGWRHAFPD